MFMRRKTAAPSAPPFPGQLVALDGSSAVVEMETAASEGAGAYPITPSTQMGEGWAQAVAAGKTNVFGRRLLFFEPEGEHAAAAVTAGMSMAGLRATNFSSGQGIAYMHESLYAAVGKRLTYVLNIAARAMTKHALNVHAGHDDYHAIDDTGFFQLFAKDVQETADLTLIAHRIAELALNPGAVAQDGFLTSHVIETVRLPERDLVRRYLGDPADLIEAPTPAQRMVFGEHRRRVPILFDMDYPTMLGTVQNQEAYAQGVAAQRPFYFDHIVALTDRAMAEFADLTGRSYARASDYRLDDADYVLVGQGSVVANAEAVADYMRSERNLKVGVLNVTMFRPFPADLIARLLAGKTAVTVLERTDQPLAVDAPLLREIRAALSQAVENGRGRGRLPHPELPMLRAELVPDLYSAGFGFGSRDLQPGDLIAAVENMLPDGRRRRQYYLGIDFVRPDTRLPKLQIWQEELLESYPQLEGLALQPADNVNLLPAGSIALRIHSVGGWGAITMGKNIALTAFELAGLHVKANPKYGSEKKGQPTTFYAVLSPEPVRLNGELRHVDVVLAPDGNVFRHSNPLIGLAKGGTFVIQSDQPADAVWASLPEHARRTIRARAIRVYALDGFGIASDEASDAELRYRMQGAAFMGAFFRLAEGARGDAVTEDALFAGIRTQLEIKFGKLGTRVVEDNLRVIRRGYDELQEIVPVDVPESAEDDVTAVAGVPAAMHPEGAEAGPGNPGRFFEQVCSVCAVGQDVLADPFTALSAMPAASSAVRDMTGIRFEVPVFHPEKCTGCSQCWTQCPDSAIPGLVSTVDDLLDTAIRSAPGGMRCERLRQIARPLAKEAQKQLRALDRPVFADVLAGAYRAVAERLNWDAERRAQLDGEFAAVHGVLAEFAVAKTAPFFDLPERKEAGSGGLLSITINPEACKGCNICVEVCPEGALTTAKQDAELVDALRRNWGFWQALPDTDDRYVNVSNVDEGIGVLPSLLLKKDTYRSMIGGDGACMGCGEKTAVHLVTSTIEAWMRPHVDAFVVRLDERIAGLEAAARGLLGGAVELADAERGTDVTVHVAPEERARLDVLLSTLAALRDLRWRYVEGPSGRGRAALGIANSTGCSSVWGSTWPYNPYPFPWVNHLFQDSPSIAIGVFEAQMRRMADGFAHVRRADLLLDGAYESARDEPALTALSWSDFTDEEFALCPPMLAIGGDGAMLDIGFQNLSRLLASGKPLRVIVLDTQVYSNTGGQACTSGFTGQVADMSAYGAVQHGKIETRKELALLGIAHRGAFVAQTSQALPAHLIGNVLRALGTRRPAVINIYTPCPVEHGLSDERAPEAARLALESRAFPFVVFDPDQGDAFADCISLDGNPALDDAWPETALDYTDDDGTPRTLRQPLTVADWAATEGRFRKHFKPIPRDQWSDEQLPFHEAWARPAAERDGAVAYIQSVGEDGRLQRFAVSPEMFTLADDRQRFWLQLRELAGVRVADSVRDTLEGGLADDYERRLQALQAEHEQKLAELRTSYSALVARRLAEGLIRHGGTRTVSELLADADRMPDLGALIDQVASVPAAPPAVGNGAGGGAATASVVAPTTVADAVHAADALAAAVPGAGPAVAAEPVAADAAEPEEIGLEPYIDTDRCTTCNECTNINSRMFAYNDNKQAYIKDARAGTFAQLVTAAERCPAGLIHPGSPLNPKEKDLEKWVKRAEPFN